MVSACSNGFESVVIGKYGGEVKKFTMIMIYRTCMRFVEIRNTRIFSQIAARSMYMYIHVHVHVVIDD